MDPRRLLLLLPLLPVASLAQAQGITIDHQPVGCIVAGKYPRLNACFSPSSKLARARVYFRASSRGSDWYYVEMQSDAPCWKGVLPKPKKELVGETVLYYVDAADRGFGESRTEEVPARVVEKASDCEAKLPVAPLLNAAAVTVFPAVPAGFAGAAGLGLGATAAIVGGGAALAGGGIAIAAGGGDSDSGSSGGSSGGPPDSFPAATVTTTTTTTTLPGFSPVFAVSKAGVPVEGASVSGSDPLVLTFDMCGSSGPYRLAFDVDVDGARAAVGCRSTITFTTAAATSSATRRPASASPSGRSYAVVMHVRSMATNNDPQASRKLTVEVGGVASGCAVDTQGPVTTLKLPGAGAVYSSPTQYPVHFEALADDAATGNNGVADVEYKVNYAGAPLKVLGPVTAAPYGFDWAYGGTDGVEAWLGTDCSRVATVVAYAVDGCGKATYSAGVPVTFQSTASTCARDAAAGADRRPSGTLLTELLAPDSSGQVVVNGTAAFSRAGRTPLAVTVARGSNQVEASLVEGSSAGTWRFELGGLPGFRPGSLRVVAGDVVHSAGDAVVFRVQGRRGERIAFVFDALP